MKDNKLQKPNRLGENVRKGAIYTFLAIWALFVLFPFYWMVLTSFKSYGAYNAEWTPQLYTLSPTLENYVSAFTKVPLWKYFTNTLIFTLATTALMLWPLCWQHLLSPVCALRVVIWYLPFSWH